MSNLNRDFLKTGRLRVADNSGDIILDGQIIPFTQLQKNYLALLIKNAGYVVTKGMAMDSLYQEYDASDRPETQILDVALCKIRRKFEAVSINEVISTVWGRGPGIDLAPDDVRSTFIDANRIRAVTKQLRSDESLTKLSPEIELPEISSDLRWSVAKKAGVTVAVRDGLIKRQDASMAYSMSDAEMDRNLQILESGQIRRLASLRL